MLGSWSLNAIVSNRVDLPVPLSPIIKVIGFETSSLLAYLTADMSKGNGCFLGQLILTLDMYDTFQNNLWLG